ncbi:MAG TPA: FkbM family methyltransferase [Usitatibacter sp.]|nr:FkbM family methyltransferase [Usitatibacter sp.]
MQLTLEQYEKIAPAAEVEHGGVRMRFATPNAVALWRVQTIREKEPWTLDWISRFTAGDVMLDCGANVGMYTVWAAATRGCRVLAFEPEAQNYALLNRNIQLNALGERVRAYCVGLSDVSGLSVLHLSDTRAGGANHALGEALDFQHQPLGTAFVQGCVAATIDALVDAGMEVPAHVKIDVDGFEPRVLAGARRTLESEGVRSLLIEINQNLADHMAMVGELHALGFRHDPAQVARAERRSGAFKGLAEYVFER